MKITIIIFLLLLFNTKTYSQEKENVLMGSIHKDENISNDKMIVGTEYIFNKNKQSHNIKFQRDSKIQNKFIEQLFLNCPTDTSNYYYLYLREDRNSKLKLEIDSCVVTYCELSLNSFSKKDIRKRSEKITGDYPNQFIDDDGNRINYHLHTDSLYLFMNFYIQFGDLLREENLYPQRYLRFIINKQSGLIETFIYGYSNRSWIKYNLINNPN